MNFREEVIKKLHQVNLTLCNTSREKDKRYEFSCIYNNANVKMQFALQCKHSWYLEIQFIKWRYEK